VLQCVAVRCSVLQCVAVCCSVLQCVAVWNGESRFSGLNFWEFHHILVWGIEFRFYELGMSGKDPSNALFLYVIFRKRAPIISGSFVKNDV